MAVLSEDYKKTSCESIPPSPGSWWLKVSGLRVTNLRCWIVATKLRRLLLFVPAACAHGGRSGPRVREAISANHPCRGGCGGGGGGGCGPHTFHNLLSDLYADTVFHSIPTVHAPSDRGEPKDLCLRHRQDLPPVCQTVRHCSTRPGNGGRVNAPMDVRQCVCFRSLDVPPTL